MAITTTGFQAPATSREGLVPSVYDKILLVGADETPLLNMISKVKANNILDSWHIDVLPEPANKPRLEIHELKAERKATVQKFSNHMKHTVDEVSVSNTMMHTKEYGGMNPWDREKGKIAKAHALNLEFTLFGAGGANKEDLFAEYELRTETTPGKTAGFFYYISKGETAFNNGRRGNVIAFDTAKDWSGDPTPISWDIILELLQVPWNKGASAKDIFVGGNLRGRISALREARSHVTIIQDNTLKGSVGKIETDFGTINIHSHRFMSKDNFLDDVILVGDFNYAQNALLMETNFKEYETGSTSKGGAFETESALRILNADAFCIGVGIGKP